VLFEWHHEVTEQETDWLGHASNVAFVDWLTNAAIAHSSAVGWTPERYVAYGAAFMVRSHRITYLAPAQAGEALRVRTWVEDVTSAKSLRRYEIERLGGERRLLARAETIWAFVDLKRGVPQRIPDDILAAFPIKTRMPDAQTNTTPPEKFPWRLSEW
jgi:acyl-CoA thioester hydrolase